MSLSTPFINRPVATTLLTIAIALAGGLAYFFLPVSPLPQVDYPSVSVSASLPGASPETMASAVATPLERQFGRIAGISEMTSTSTQGTTNITLLFDLNRDLNAAARDVQAAINAAAGNLPANLPSKPTYRKINPADAPIMILTMTSDTYGKPAMYDAASSILSQSLSQVQGVGQVNVGGSALPGVRVEVNPTLLNNFGLGLEDVRNALAAANANRPKGEIEGHGKVLSLNTTDQLFKADQYRSLIIAYRNGAPVRVGDVAKVVDSVEDIRQMGLACTAGVDSGGKRVPIVKDAVLLVIFRQPGANIISTVDEIKKRLPMLQASIPPGMNIGIGLDRTLTIRASVEDVKFTLLVSIALVVLVVFIFLRDIRATLIPSVAVPVSLIGTFGIMYLLGYSLDNLSLMALCIATGFVVDDAIVVTENISRHIEDGLEPLQAALKGAAEIGFTVLSISVSLVAVFIPILMMGGYIGRLFREFAVTLSVAIFVSMVISLTTTPMMAAILLKSKKDRDPGPLYRASENVFDWILWVYETGLRWVLRHQFLMLITTIVTIALTVFLYIRIPKGLFPQQDTGRISGFLKADQDTSFQAMEVRLKQFASAVAEDPNVDTTLAFSGGRGAFNQAQMFATLKPIGQRKETVDQVLADLRRKTARIPGATLIFQPVQDFRIGGRQSSSQYQFTLQGDDLKELNTWAPILKNKLSTMTKEGIVDVDSDQQNGGLQADLTYDRNTAARMGITSQQMDQTLYDALGQEQVSTMYAQLNQYHVVMEVNKNFWQNPDSLKYIYVEGTGDAQVPLSAISHFTADTTPLAVNHSGVFPSITISFNLLPGVSLGDAVVSIQNAERDIGMPASIHGNFSGAAQAFQDSLSNMPLLILAALVTVYIVLGILYESLIHPITILSTLPSAGVGALLALITMHTDLTVIAVIGIILLIGIVKKNAIMMIDFALEAERNSGKTPEEAIFQACTLRFRPITMTTMAALLGGLPLAIGGGTGSELRTPLGIAIVGGLIFSQMLTLFTTPVIYLYLDRLRLWLSGKEHETRPIWAEPGLATPQWSPA
jgi:hydrophobe/amphiphile efflux-1 (HAE1) family protein